MNIYGQRLDLAYASKVILLDGWWNDAWWDCMVEHWNQSRIRVYHYLSVSGWAYCVPALLSDLRGPLSRYRTSCMYLVISIAAALQESMLVKELVTRAHLLDMLLLHNKRTVDPDSRGRVAPVQSPPRGGCSSS